MANQEMNRVRQTGRFFYGYVVAAAAFLAIMAAWGPNNAYGVFFNPMRTEFDWTFAMTSGAFSLSMIVGGILGIVAGGLTDRFGPRMVLTVSGIILGLGYMLMSQVNSAWQLYLFYGVVIGVGVSGTFIPPLSTVARWFDRRRSLMSSIAVSGIGIGGLIAPPVITRLISVYGWRLTYVILGGVVLVAEVLVARFLKRDPARIGQVPYGRVEGEPAGLKTEAKGFSLKEAAATWQFWIVFIIFASFGVSMFSIAVHIVPHLVDLRIPADTAANILAVILGVRVLGIFVLGSAGDKIGSRWIYIIALALVVVTLLWLLVAREVWMFYLFAVVFGFAHGGLVTSESPLVVSLFGLKSLGAILGVTLFGFTVGAAVGPLVTGYIHDVTSSYQVAFLVCAVVAAVGLILSVILRPVKKPETQGVTGPR